MKYSRSGTRLSVIAMGAAVLLLLGISACSGSSSASPWSGEEQSGLTDVGVDDGYIEEGESISPFDDEHPALAKLDPALREAMQDAATAAIDDGFTFVVTAGWRSERYQRAMLDDAIRSYGSEEEALKWVNTPERSTHVTGQAVDIGFTDANSWLSQHGSDYGLCQAYANEMWHFELLTEPGGECPQQLSTPADG